MRSIERRPAAVTAVVVAVLGVALAFVALVVCMGPDVIETDGCGGKGTGISGIECEDVSAFGAADDSIETAPEVTAALPSGSKLLEQEASIPEAGVSLLPVCAEKGVLESTARSGLGVRATWEVGVGLVEAAASIVEFYRDAGGCALAYDGYLDLMGCVWGCAVQSDDGWVELAIVDERGSGGDAAEEDNGSQSCSVTVVRFGEP